MDEVTGKWKAPKDSSRKKRPRGKGINGRGLWRFFLEVRGVETNQSEMVSSQLLQKLNLARPGLNNFNEQIFYPACQFSMYYLKAY